MNPNLKYKAYTDVEWIAHYKDHDLDNPCLGYFAVIVPERGSIRRCCIKYQYKIDTYLNQLSEEPELYTLHMDGSFVHASKDMEFLKQLAYGCYKVVVEKETKTRQNPATSEEMVGHWYSGDKSHRSYIEMVLLPDGTGILDNFDGLTEITWRVDDGVFLIKNPSGYFAPYCFEITKTEPDRFSLNGSYRDFSKFTDDIFAAAKKLRADSRYKNY